MKAKTKILLALVFVMALCLALALGAYATEIAYSWGATEPELTTLNGMTAKDKLDTTSCSIIQKGNGDYIKIPSYYFVKNQTTLDLDFTELSTALDETITGAQVYSMEVPSGITTLNAGIFGTNGGGQNHKCVNVEHVVLPETCLSFGYQPFRTAIHLKLLHLPTGMTSIPTWFMAGCTSLVTIDNFAQTKVTSIDACAMNDCDLSGGLEFPSTLTTIQQALNRTNLPYVDLSNTQLTTLNGSAFHTCKELTYAIFPTTFTAMSGSSFDTTAKMRYIVFLGKMTNVNIQYIKTEVTLYFAQNSVSDLNGKYVESDFKNNNLVFVDMPNAYTEKTDGTLNFTSYTTNVNSATTYQTIDNVKWNKVNTNQVRLAFCQDEKMVYYVRTQTNGWDGGKIAVYDFEDVLTQYPTTAVHCKDTGTQTPATCLLNAKVTYKCVCCGETLETVETENSALNHNFVTYNVVTPADCIHKGSESATCTRCPEVDVREISATGIHTFTVNVPAQTVSCTQIGWDAYTTCSVCSEKNGYVEIPMLPHSYTGTVTIVYANGLDHVGTKTTQCANCVATDETEVVAIIVVEGYSTCEIEENGQILAGYSINQNALAEYNQAFTFGVLVGYGDNTVATNFASVLAGNENEKVFGIEVDTSYSRVNITIDGITANDQDIPLVICAFTKQGEDVAYYQNGTGTAIGETGFNKVTYGILKGVSV